MVLSAPNAVIAIESTSGLETCAHGYVSLFPCTWLDPSTLLPRSSIADMKNSVANRSNAQVSCAAQFIANHMEAFIAGPKAGGGRWLHVDMAFPAHQGERCGQHE